MTGNTHRTEFCIDKMYTPEGGSGRRGLVEFRALGDAAARAHGGGADAADALGASRRSGSRRTSGGWCAGAPACTTISCCRITCAQDFARRAGGAARARLRAGSGLVRAAFRVPLPARSARSRCAAPTLELRHALEPWHVLGEETGAGGTARYVDSSVERVQARVDGWVDERYVLACNGRAVPLTPTDREGEYVGGVRFKAWNPPSALHPTIAGADAAGVRHLRPLERPFAGRPDPSRRASGRAQLRTLPGERQRGGGAAARRGSSRSATRRDRCRSRWWRGHASTRARWICGGSPDTTAARSQQPDDGSRGDHAEEAAQAVLQQNGVEVQAASASWQPLRWR